MFEANIQVLLCIQRFQAINAKYTHPYSIAVKVSTQDHKGETIEALPHSIVSRSQQEQGGYIDSKSSCYLTPYIKVQPNNYTIDINQICSFKFNIEWKNNTNQTQLLVEVFLYILNNPIKFTPVGSQMFKLKKLTGRSTYLPVFFQGFQYTCFLNASIHTQLIGIKWKKSRQSIDNIQSQDQLKAQNPKYNNFTEYIMGQTSMKLSLLTDLQQKYTKLLLSNIEKLQHSIHKIEPSIQFQIPKLTQLNPADSNQWSFQFLNNLNELSGYCFRLWNQYIRIRLTFPDMKYLRQTFEDQLKFQYHNHIYDKVCQETKSQKMIERKIDNEIIVVGDLKLPRSVKVFLSRVDLPINTNFYIKSNNQSFQSESHEQHLIILVHGLSANRIAMQALKNIMIYYYPHLRVITSISNQNRTEQHIEDMGKRLADEVRFIISSQKLVNYKLSFISHSLGGLITRAALLHLQSFKNHFEIFITLGTPHLGYLFHHSSLIKMGIWFLNKWKPSLSLSMLNFNDKHNLNESYLYRLSMQPGFQWFKHVVLVSNPKDSYVSQHSSLIQLCQQAKSDYQQKGERGNLYYEILDNLTKRLNKVTTTRLTVYGLLSTKTGMDSFIGRTAHIEYLSDNTFLKMFVLTHQKLFQ